MRVERDRGARGFKEAGFDAFPTLRHWYTRRLTADYFLYQQRGVAAITCVYFPPGYYLTLCMCAITVVDTIRHKGQTRHMSRWSSDAVLSYHLLKR